MRIERFIEVMQEFQKEHPCCEVVIRRDTGYDVPVVSYNVTNVVNSIAPGEYIQIL